MRQYDKLINQAAKEILAPYGMFRKGSSRIWLDDNGYFMIQTEFQPSGYSQGSYLNVGISFLWEASRGLNETLAFDYGYREAAEGKQFVRYKEGSDDEFRKEIEVFSGIALQKVLEYRQFRDMDYAKKKLTEKLRKTSKKSCFWEPYQLSMLCFLKGDFEEGKKYFYSFMEILKKSFYNGDFYIEWHEEFYNHCTETILPAITARESAQDMVLKMIKRRRDYFSSKPSYKKMNKADFLYS